MRLKSILVALALLVIGLGAVAVTVIKSIDFNAYKDLVTQQVKVALGRDLVIAGDVSVEIGLVPHLTAKQITFRNATWSDQPQMISVDRLDAEVELLPLLSEQIRIRQVTLSGGDLILERNDKGVGNWSFTGAASSAGGSGAPLPEVGQIKLENVRLRYRDPIHSLDRSLQIARLTATTTQPAGAIAWSLTGMTGDTPIDLKGNFGSISQMANGPFPLDLHGSVGDLGLQARASIGSLSTLHGLDIDAQFSGSNAAKMNALLGAKLPETPAFKISTHATDQNKGYHLDHIAIMFGKSTVNGDITVLLDRDQPLLSGQLTSDRLDLADFGFAVADTKSPAPSTGNAGNRLFSSAPWNFDGLRAIDADLTVTIGELLRGQSILKDGRVAVKLDRGVLTLESLSAVIDQGRFDASGALRANTDKPSLDLKVKGANIASSPVLAAAGLSDVLSAGAVNLDLAVKGPASSEHDLMAGLSGNLHFATGAGTLRNSFAEFLLADLTKVIAFGGTADATKVNCIAGHFDIAGGVARTNSLVMDTPGAAVLGTGEINLGAETLNMRVDSKSKQVSLAALAVPMLISGELRHPSVAPDAVGAVANTGSFVAGTANMVTLGMLGDLTGIGAGGTSVNACSTAADAGAKQQSSGSKIKEGAAAIGSGAKQVIEGVGEGAGGVVKDVGKSLDSGLKSIFGN
jgi:hypothetical protein